MTSWSILQGDARDSLSAIPSSTARTCVTSPPYFGLRDYGTATWEGGDPTCEHIEKLQHREQPDRPTQDGAFRHTSTPLPVPFRDVCGHCGAQRVDQQIGLEATPDEFVSAIVSVFRGVRRVLTDDGTAWLNIGDSYAGSWGAQGRTGQMAGRSVISARQIENHPTGTRTGSIPKAAGYKAKDLMGIPWMVAFALRADGWYLRSDVIWHKPNPMPESTRDRPTSAHEHVFLLSKAPRYFYDSDAIRQPLAAGSAERIEAGFRDRYADGAVDGRGYRGPVGGEEGMKVPEKGANARNVWSITSKPFKGAHFACMPPDLAERCILAGSEEGDTVLDPFAGAGTTGMVALRRGRSFVGTELNPDYVEIARRRIADDSPLFNTTAEVAA